MSAVGPAISKQVRQVRTHRHTKSGPVTNPPPQQHQHFNKNMASQPRNLPHHPHHHAAHHQQQVPPPRSQHVESNTPPQTPKNDATGKRRRRQRKFRDGPPQSETENEAPPMPRAAPPKHHSAPAAAAASPPRDYSVFAGPAFHHSPAAASLPVPKFFSKSLPQNRPGSLQAMVDAEPRSPPAQEENHLEKLFKADREQRSRQQPVLSADESSDDASSDTSNRDAFFGMEPDSPFGARLNNKAATPVRPQHGRSTTEPFYSTAPQQRVSSPLAGKENQTYGSQAYLQSLIYRTPYSPGQSAASPMGSPSPSPAMRPRAAQPVPYSPYDSPSHGSPVPRKVDYGYMNGAVPPKPPQFYLPQPAPQQRPPVYHQEPSPARGPHPVFFVGKKDVAPVACQDDITSMEDSLRRILKLEPQPVGMPMPGAVAI